MLRPAPRSWLAAALLLAVVTAPRAAADTRGAASGVAFRIEPQFQRSVDSSGPIAAGSVLTFDVEGLHPRTRLAVSLCGPDCDSAKGVLELVGSDDTRPRRGSVHVDETGRYYFWLQQATSAGTVGPVRAETLSVVAGGVRVDFADGTRVTVTVEPPAAGAAQPSAAQGRDRIEIVSVSPVAAPRGLESEFTIELDIELASLTDGVVMLGFNSATPASYRMVETLPVARGSRRLTVHLRGMVVDWQERGRFGVQAHLGARPGSGVSWKPVATAVSEIAAVP